MPSPLRRRTLPFRRALLSLLACVSLVTAFAAGADQPETLTSDRIHGGMRGYGLTVFAGTRIDTFQVEVLAVLRNYNVQSDAIIIRASGGPIDESGIVQGMSGSPVYIDGKLIGAVAWTMSFSKSPIGGVTPIQSMMTLSDRPLGQPPESRNVWQPGTSITPAMSPTEQNTVRRQALQPLTLPAEWSRDPGLAPFAGQTLVPLRTPVAIQGLDSRAMAYVQEILAPYNVSVVQGGGAGVQDSLEGVRLEPGSALGVAMATGDFSAYATGTVTACMGDTVLGFGHPMFGKGYLDFPMSLAYIHFFWPSQYISFKMASGGPVVGAIRQDRAHGVAGVVGDVPSMIPVEVNITGGRAPHSVRYEVTRDADIGPRMASIGVLVALSDLEALAGPAAVELSQTIELQRGDSVSTVRRDNFYTDFNGLAAAAQAAAWPIEVLTTNPFETIHINRITFEISFRESIEAAFLTGLEIPRRVVRPGEPVIVRSRFQTYQGERFERESRVMIDDETPDGLYLLRVGDANTALQWEFQRAPGRFMPASLDELIGILNYRIRNDRYTVEVVNEALGMTIDDQVLPSLPRTTFEMLRFTVPGGRIGPVLGDPVSRVEVPAELYVLGSQQIPVAVYRYARPQ